MHILQKRWCLWHPPSLIPFHLSFDLQSTFVVYIWYIPYAECGSCVFGKRINGIGQKLAKNHLCARSHLVVFNAWIPIVSLIRWCQYSSNLLSLLLPCPQEAEFMELEVMEPKEQSGAPHLVKIQEHSRGLDSHQQEGAPLPVHLSIQVWPQARVLIHQQALRNSLLIASAVNSLVTDCRKHHQ
jgi:hypothetical protein